MQYYDSEKLQKYPKLLEYFKKSLSADNVNISHCLLFWGSDIEAQCCLALEIARLLNCTGDKSENCQCLNCRWIREQAHPAVKIYTRLDFKEAETNSGEQEATKGKKNITLEQAKAIINELSVSSEYHRVYIFCDRDEEGNLLPLNRLIFPDFTADTLLKTFEEPPSDTTFFFLTNDVTDIISTVVSRSQSFFVPSFEQCDCDYSMVESVIKDYWNINRNDVLEFEQNLYALMNEHDAKEILKQIQNYMAEVLKLNFENKPLFYKIVSDIKYVEDALRQISLTPAMNLQTVVENLCFNIIL